MMRNYNCLILCFLFCILAASVIPESQKNDPLSTESHTKEGEHNPSYDHDAFLGHEDAEAFEELSPEESKARLEKMLPKIDADSDGYITDQELQNHIKFMQTRYITNDVERTWLTHEPGADTLKWKTYRESIYGSEDDGRTIEEDYARMIERDRKRWEAADQDKDDVLTKEEYSCFMHPENCDHMKDIVVQETIKDIDKDGDGYVDLEEYISDMFRPEDTEGETEEPDWVKSEREMFAEFRDKNGDGKLDVDEMREWIVPTGFDHAEAEAKHLVALADDDKDGKLSKEEILAHYDVFVGSQATDYGEQLQKHDPSEF